MEYRSRGIQRLQLVLDIQRVEDIRGIIHRKVGTVGIVGRIPILARRLDIRPFGPVVFCQAVRSGFRRRRLQIIQFSVFLLIIRKPVSHMIQHIFRELLGARIGHIAAQPSGVQTRFVHADQADGGEMVVKASQIPFGVGVKSSIQQLGDHLSLHMEGTGGKIHQTVQPPVKILLVFCQVSDTGHIDGHHAHGTGALAGTEIAAGFLSQFAQIQTQTAAHTPHIAGLHITVDIVGKVRRAVFCCHLKKQAVILRVGPVEIGSDGIGRNRILESPSVGIPFDHGLDKGLVDHIHLFFAVFIFKVHLFAAHDGRKFRQIVGNCPVQSDIGKRSLGSPPTGCIDAVDEGFDTLFHLRIRQMIRLDKGRQIRIK